MHEASMTMQLIDYLDKVAQENNAKKILDIYLEVGEFTHLNPDQIRYLFDILKERNEVLKKSKLHIERRKGIVKCDSCGYIGNINIDNEYDLYLPVFSCPKCGSLVKVVEGDEFIIKKIRMIK
jgi:hydrogenase nickel incorporation protein HypA/HybF